MITCDKPQETIHGGSQAFLTNTKELLRAFLRNTKRLLKTHIFEIKATFPVKKILWPIFSRNIESDKH